MASSRLQELIDLAKETSSARRRELLREITDLFFSRAAQVGPTELPLFDTVLTRLARDMEEAVRAELAGRFAEAANAPGGLIRTLANDTLAVAAPVLAHSSRLSEDDLIEVVKTRSQGHVRAISQRQEVSQRLSEVIVDHADDQTLDVLLRNEGAHLSRDAAETVVARAQASPFLHEAVVERPDLPPDLLNEMYFVVEARLRQRILDENARLDPSLLEQALQAGRKRVARQDGALPADYDQAEAYVSELKTAGELTPRVLARFLRSGGSTHFLVALAQLADIDFHTAKRIVDRRELDGLAVVCRAADLDRALFLTYALVLLGDGPEGASRAQEYARLYGDLPKETALRTLRFWRMRRQTAELAAA